MVMVMVMVVVLLMPTVIAMMVVMVVIHLDPNLSHIHLVAARFARARSVVGYEQGERVRDRVKQVGIGRRLQRLNRGGTNRIGGSHRRQGSSGAKQARNPFIHNLSSGNQRKHPQVGAFIASQATPTLRQSSLLGGLALQRLFLGC